MTAEYRPQLVIMGLTRAEADRNDLKPRSFVEFSASRVGKVWTEEDHAAHHLAQAEELCITILETAAERHECRLLETAKLLSWQRPNS
jgi:hypothetical protein